VTGNRKGDAEKARYWQWTISEAARSGLTKHPAGRWKGNVPGFPKCFALRLLVQLGVLDVTQSSTISQSQQ